VLSGWRVRTNCPDGSKAIYNRPTGKNTKKSTYGPPPPCDGETPVCSDGSEAKPRFNQCTKDEMKCPTGQGQGAYDKPFPVCADGSKCDCPGPGENCQFHYRKCANGQGCRKPCRSGVPHCPWFTKNRNKHDGNKVYNTGAERPANRPEGHHWGPKYKGNQAFPGKTP